VLEALKNYLTLASGATSLTRQRAVDAARQLVAQGEATAGQVQTLATDLLATSRSNREALVNLVRGEVDRTLGRLGLATAEEVAALRARLRTLEGGGSTKTASAKRSASASKASKAARPAKATKKTAKKTGKESTARKQPSRAPAKRTVGKRATTRRAPAKRTNAKRASAKRATGKRTTTRRAPVKRTATKRTAAKRSRSRRSR
jgi:polyhydroxyalkanoate synthesis regulator phasin